MHKVLEPETSKSVRLGRRGPNSWRSWEVTAQLLRLREVSLLRFDGPASLKPQNVMEKMIKPNEKDRGINIENE